MIRISNTENYPAFRFTDTETGAELSPVLDFVINTPKPGEDTTATITVLAEIDILVYGEVKQITWKDKVSDDGTGEIKQPEGK